MNSSLPSFLAASPALPSAAGATVPLNVAPPGGLSPAPAGAPVAPAVDFSDLMAATVPSAAPQASVTMQAVAAAPSVITLAAPGQRFANLPPTTEPAAVASAAMFVPPAADAGLRLVSAPSPAPESTGDTTGTPLISTEVAPPVTEVSAEIQIGRAHV